MLDTTNTLQTPVSSGHVDIRGFLLSIGLNTVIPLGLYQLTKHYISPSEVVALSVAALFPLIESIFEVTRHRQFNLIAIFTLLGIVVGLIGVFLGGDSKILLIKESFFWGTLGMVCLVSLLFPRPLMFYVGRQFMAGKDPEKLARYYAEADDPYGRFIHRLITAVWGIAWVGEFTLRVVLVYTLPAAFVLALSPILLGAITVGTFVWTFAYIRYATKRGMEIRRQQEQGGVAGTSPATTTIHENRAPAAVV